MPLTPPTPGRKRAVRRDDHLNAVERALEDLGYSSYRFGRRNNGHREVIVTLDDGTEVSVTFPFSSVNWNGPRKAAAKLRHKLKLAGALA